MKNADNLRHIRQAHIVKSDVRRNIFNVQWPTVSLTTTICGVGCQNMNFYPYEIGDMIAISKPGYKHFGIYVGSRGIYGSSVVHNCKREGVILSSLSDFSGNSPIFIHQKATGKFRVERETIAQRALSLLGTKYDLIQFNCEHAALTQSGFGRSPQIIGAALLALCIAGLVLVALKKA